MMEYDICSMYVSKNTVSNVKIDIIGIRLIYI